MLNDFDTDRLSIRNWSVLLGDPVQRPILNAALARALTRPVLAHLPDQLQMTDPAHEIAAWIDARAAESAGFTVCARHDDTLLGLLMLVEIAEDCGMRAWHLGYLLAQSAWGQGYASEMVGGLVDACRSAGPMRLIGGVGHGNKASARVLEKAGFHRDAGASVEGTDMFTLSIA